MDSATITINFDSTIAITNFKNGNFKSPRIVKTYPIYFENSDFESYRVISTCLYLYIYTYNSIATTIPIISTIISTTILTTTTIIITIIPIITHFDNGDFESP